VPAFDIFIFLRYFQLLSNQPTPAVGELTPKFDSNQSACNCVVGYQVVFEVRPSDHSLFFVSVQVVEAETLFGTVTTINNTKVAATFSRLKPAATNRGKAKLRFAATNLNFRDK